MTGQAQTVVVHWDQDTNYDFSTYDPQFPVTIGLCWERNFDHFKQYHTPEMRRDTIRGLAVPVKGPVNKFFCRPDLKIEFPICVKIFQQDTNMGRNSIVRIDSIVVDNDLLRAQTSAHPHILDYTNHLNEHRTDTMIIIPFPAPVVVYDTFYIGMSTTSLPMAGALDRIYTEFFSVRVACFLPHDPKIIAKHTPGNQFSSPEHWEFTDDLARARDERDWFRMAPVMLPIRHLEDYYIPEIPGDTISGDDTLSVPDIDTFACPATPRPELVRYDQEDSTAWFAVPADSGVYACQFAFVNSGNDPDWNNLIECGPAADGSFLVRYAPVDTSHCYHVWARYLCHYSGEAFDSIMPGDWSAPLVVCPRQLFDTTLHNPGEGIGDIGRQGFRLYPNPTQGELRVECGEESLGQVLTVVDISGRVVFSATLRSTLTTLDLGELPDGIYHILLPGAPPQRFVIRR